MPLFTNSVVVVDSLFPFGKSFESVVFEFSTSLSVEISVLRDVRPGAVLPFISDFGCACNDCVISSVAGGDGLGWELLESGVATESFGVGASGVVGVDNSLGGVGDLVGVTGVVGDAGVVTGESGAAEND